MPPVGVALTQCYSSTGDNAPAMIPNQIKWICSGGGIVLFCHLQGLCALLPTHRQPLTHLWAAGNPHIRRCSGLGRSGIAHGWSSPVCLLCLPPALTQNQPLIATFWRGSRFNALLQDGEQGSQRGSPAPGEGDKDIGNGWGKGTEHPWGRARPHKGLRPRAAEQTQVCCLPLLLYIPFSHTSAAGTCPGNGSSAPGCFSSSLT